MATGNYTLPQPQELEIHDLQAAKKWKKFIRAWELFTSDGAKREVGNNPGGDITAMVQEEQFANSYRFVR